MKSNRGARLGVNIDHIATLRQARGEKYPCVAHAARVVLEAGADQITIHLREDRRHIQDNDVYEIKKITDEFKVPLNFEMGANTEIVDIAINLNPAWICLVPEKREEQTTEGGLNLMDNKQLLKIQNTIKKLRLNLKNVKISLFVESNEETIKRCLELEVDAVEIHTGDYAKDFILEKDVVAHLTRFKQTYNQLIDSGIGFHAGHGLTSESLIPLLQQGLFVEYNIGHWIIADSVFLGLSRTVKNLKETIKNHLIN